MKTFKRIILALILLVPMLSTAAAQSGVDRMTQGTSTVTAGANSGRVRITAPASVVQMHVEVYAASGEKLLDNEIRGGNVFDWHLQDGQGQHLSVGDYVCVVTVKNIAGRITQKIGAVRMGEKDVSVQPAAQLSSQQSQAIGPVEENSSWTVLKENENQTTTVIAHDGSDGQVTRGRGALSFRLGDFFSGNDKEQMRLTEEGNLGIGASKPQFKLDVAGAIRARQGFVFRWRWPRPMTSRSKTSRRPCYICILSNRWMRKRFMRAFASRTVSSGRRVIGLRIIPDSDRFTRSTSAA